jgi:hypothetical protein
LTLVSPLGKPEQKPMDFQPIQPIHTQSTVYQSFFSKADDAAKNNFQKSGQSQEPMSFFQSSTDMRTLTKQGLDLQDDEEDEYQENEGDEGDNSAEEEMDDEMAPQMVDESPAGTSKVIQT